MHYVLVHGWGFHAGIWSGFVNHLDEAEVTLVDLGFVAGGPDGEKSWPKDAIAVGERAIKAGKEDPEKPDTRTMESKLQEWKGKKS